RVVLDADAAARLGHGQPVEHPDRRAQDVARLRVYDTGERLLGVASCRSGRLTATRLVAGIAQDARPAPRIA
ncbi:MAG TPA: tRNA pseudouridine(55) synthase TruB, partial [Burkholderiaceae bacterium]|nr:tRNA pseudouridine(55) synthase TruB [Burkholderiaceae bacterium]